LYLRKGKEMEENLNKIKERIESQISKIQEMNDLDKFKSEILGKKGELTQILKNMKNYDENERRKVGKAVNDAKNNIEAKIEEKREIIKKIELSKRLEKIERVDFSLPVNDELGSLHPITVVQREIEEIFRTMGFTVEDGNEVETEYNNFEAVNVPKYHPARDMQDTYWLENGQLLKTQTSAAQNRIMKKYGAPLKAIFPGRCFRNESLDASHENTFFQLEGMMIDENISVANLIYFMKTTLSEIFKKDLKVRLRPGFFPFVEPGFELDVSCMYCNGKGCKVCKHGGWIELCPCGLIHPNVLEMGGIDPEKYSGFAFGLGLSRLAMMKYGINDLRYLNSGDLRVLKQIGIK
jgi:phenylalanyl-tRNA synthetase alpha chain